MSSEQIVSEKVLFYSPHDSLFSPFPLPHHNWNNLFSNVVLETKIKIILTSLIVISCSADITRPSYLPITQEGTSCTLRAFLKCSEFVFQLCIHLLLLGKQEDGIKMFHGNHYAASCPNRFWSLWSWNLTSSMVNKNSYRPAMKPVKVSFSLCIIIYDGYGRAKVKYL